MAATKPAVTWRRLVAGLASVALALGGLSLTSMFSGVPEAQAAPGDATVTSWAELQAAINNSTVTTIYLANNIQRTSDTTAANDLPAINRDLTVNGQGFSLDFRAGGATTAIARPGFPLANAGTGTFTLTNIDIIRPNGGAYSLINTAANPASNILNNTTATNNSRNWTVSISDLKTSVAPSSGLVTLPAGTVNFTGKVVWDSSTGSNPATVVVNAKTVNISGAGTDVTFRNHSASGDTTSDMPTFQVAQDGVMNSVNVTDGAQALVENLGRGSTQAISMTSGGDSRGAGTGDQFNVSGAGTVLNVNGWGNGTGATGATVTMVGSPTTAGDQGFDISGGAIMNVHAWVTPGVNNGTNGMPALIQQIDGGVFKVDGPGTQLNVQADGAGNTLAGAIRIRLVGNQTLQVSNLGELNVKRPQRTGGYTPPTIRFGPGTYNSFIVNTGGLVHIENDGNGTIQTSDSAGNSGAVEYAANYFTFDIDGSAVWPAGTPKAGQTQPSAVELIATSGPAVCASGQNYGQIAMTNGAVFVADGNVNSSSNGIFGAGTNFKFTSSSPQYYDFANNNPRQGAIVFDTSGSASIFSQTNSDLAVWGNGSSRTSNSTSSSTTNSSDNPVNGNPYKSWTLVDDLELSGANFINMTRVPTSPTTLTTAPDSFGTGGMSSWRRISGNNAPPTIREMQQPTNADLFVRATGTVAEGLDFYGRPIWTDEVYSRWQITDPLGSVSTSAAGQDYSAQTEDIYTVENAGSLQGVVGYSNGSLLVTGTTYQLTQAWRGDVDDPNSTQIHAATAGDILTGPVTVTDILPPVPADIETPIAAALIGADVAAHGTWSNAAAQASAQPNNPDPAVSLTVVVNTPGNVVTDCTAGLHADGTWDCDLPASLTSTLNTGDKVFFVLTDANGNANPLVATPVHDVMVPPAPYLTASTANIVAQDFTMTTHDATVMMSAANRDAQLIAAAHAAATSLGANVIVTDVQIPNPATVGSFPVTFQIAGEPVNATNTVTVTATIVYNPACDGVFTVDPVANLADDSTWQVADGTEYYTGTLQINDCYGDPAGGLTTSDVAFAASSSAVTVSGITDNGNGNFSVQYSTIKADDSYTASGTLRGTAVGTHLPIPFKAGPPSALCSSMSPLDGSSVVGTYVQVTAHIADANCNPLRNVPVTFGPTSGTPSSTATLWQDDAGALAYTDAIRTDGDGDAFVYVSDDYPNVVTIPGSYPADGAAGTGAATPIDPPAKVTFANTPVDPWMSTLEMSPDPGPVVVTDTANYYTLTATAKGSTGAPIAGVQIDFSMVDPTGKAVMTDAAVGGSPTNFCVTDGTGSCQVFVSDTKPGTVTVTGTIGGNEIQGEGVPAKASPKSLVFKAGPPSQECTDMVMSPLDGTATVGTKTTVTAHVTDALCNPLENVPVTFGPATGSTTASLYNAAGTAALTNPVLTDANGDAVIQVGDTSPSTVTIPGSYPADGAAGTGPATSFDPPNGPAKVTFNNTPVDPYMSTLTMSPDPGPVVVTDSANYYTLTATAKGSTGAPIGGVRIDFTMTDPTGSAVMSDAATSGTSTNFCVTDGTGSCQVFVSDTKPGTVTVTGKIAGDEIQGEGDPAKASPKSLVFKAGPPAPCPTNGTGMTPLDGTATVGDKTTVSAHITDALCNPLEGVPVTFGPVTGSTTASLYNAAGTAPLTNPVLTDANGDASVQVSDTNPNTVTIPGSYPADGAAGTGAATSIAPPNGNGPAKVTFNNTNADPAMSDLTVDKLTAAAPGPIIATVIARGSTGAPVAGETVAFTLSSASGYAVVKDATGTAITSSCVTGDGTGGTTLGQCSVQISDIRAEDVTLHGMIAGSDIGTGRPSGPDPTIDSPKTLTFTAGPIDFTKSTFTMSPTSLNVNEVSTATVTLSDANDNPISGVTATIAPAAGGNATFVGGLNTCVTGSTGNPAGVCTVQVTDSKNETVNFSATVPVAGSPAQVGQSVAVTWGHGPVSDANSSWGVSPTTTKAGSNAKVTITVRDASNNPIDDLSMTDFVVAGVSAGLPNVTFSNYSNAGGGVYTFDSTSTTMGTFNYTVTINDPVGGTAVSLTHPAQIVQVTFTPGDICVSNCINTDPAFQTRFEVGVNNSFANGSATDTIIAYAFDTYGNPVSATNAYTLTDQTSGANAGRLNPQTTSGSTDATGKGTSSFTTTAYGTYTLHGTFATSLGNLAPTVNPSPQLTFVTTGASGGSISIEQLNNVVGTTTFADITATDSQGSLLGDVSVSLTASSPNVALGSASGTSTYTCTTNNVAGSADFGTCKVSVTAKLAGDYTVSASIGGSPLVGSPAPVNFVADIVCYTGCDPIDPTHLTHVLVTSDGALANNSATNTVTAWAYDKFGNPVANAKVWSTPLSAPALTVVTGTAASPQLTDAAGVATLTYRSTSASSQQATVLIQDATVLTPTEPKDPSGPSPVTMTFAAGLGDPDHSMVEIAPLTSQAVDSDFTITATIHDVTDNPVGGVVVNFTPDSGLTMTNATSGAATLSCVTGNGSGGTTLGVCQVKVTATIAATYETGATIANAGGTQQAIQGSPVEAVFTAGPICIEPACSYDPGVPDDQRTHVSMTTNDVTNDGSARDVATAVASDRHGNLITGAVFQATTTDPMTILPIDPTTNGTTQIYFTSMTAGSFQSAVTVNNASGIPVAAPGSPVNPRFGTGQFSSGSFTVTPKVTGTLTPLVVGTGAVNTYTITATALDAAGGPAKNVGVQFTILPAGTTWVSTNACVTDATTGKCSVDVYSTKSGTFMVEAAVGLTPFGTAQSAIWKPDGVCAVGCDPQPSATLFTHVTLTTNNAMADGQDQDVVTVYTYDQWGNAVPGVVVKATGLDSDLIPESGIVPTQADGTTTVSFTTTKAGEHQAHITVDIDDKEVAGANPVTMTFRPGPVSAANSTLTTDATSATVGGYVTATATARDVNDNLVPNVRVTFGTTLSATATPTSCMTGDGTGGTVYGVCTSRISDNVAEVSTVTATVPVGAGATETLITPTAGIDVTFGFGAVDPAHSNLTVNPTEQTAGVDVTVTVTAHDAQDNAITNLTVNDITVTGRATGLTDLVMRSFTNNLDGTYSFQTTSRLVGTFTLGATAGGVALTQHPTVSFVAGDVCVSNCDPVDPTHVTRFEVVADGAQANGSARDTVEAWAYDTNGNAVSGATVVLSDETNTTGLVGKLTQVNPAPVHTAADGTVTVDFTALAAGMYTLQGTINGLSPVGTSPATGSVQYLNYVPGNVNAANSTLELDKHTAEVGDPITATVTTRDAQGSLVGGVSVALSATPSGVTFTTTCVTSTVAGADFGTCVVPFTSDLAKTYQVSATIGGVQVGGNGDLTKASPQSVTFTPGDVCFSNCHPVDDPDTPGVDESVTNFTHVEVTTNGVLANGTATNVVTAYAYDTFGNAVQGASVTSTPLNAPNLTVVAPGTTASPATTNGNGMATVKYTSTRAYDPQQATVLINGQEVKHPTDANLSSPVTLTFAGGVGDPAHSKVEIAPTTSQPVDSLFTITATVNDSTDNPVGGVVVSFTPQSGLTMASLAGTPTTTCVTADGTGGTTKGVCEVTVTTTVVGSYQIGATIPNASGQATAVVGSPVTAVFTHGDICVAAEGCDPDLGAPATTVVMTIDGRPGDGSSHNVATVSAYDRHGNPVDGAVVTAAPTSSTTGLTVQPAGDITPTNAQGQSTVWFTANANGAYAADFTVGGKVPNGSPLTMRFGDGVGDAAHSSFAITPAVPGSAVPLTVGTAAVNSYQVKATVNDTFDHPAAGALVIFQITPAGPVWANGDAQCTTGSDGTCFVTVSSIVAGSFNVTASLNGEAIEQAKPATWKPDGVCADDCTPQPVVTRLDLQTHFVVTRDNMVANGVQFDQVTVYARDQYGNPVPGVVIASEPAAGETSLVVGSSVGTDDQGMAVLNYSSLVAGDHTATITADGHPVADGIGSHQRIVTVNFVPGAADPTKSTLEVNPTTSPSGTAVTAMLTARDANSNLVPNVTGTFAVTGSATLAPTATAAPFAAEATCVTGTTVGAADYGKCQISVNDLVAETVTVTATIPVGAGQALVMPTAGVQVVFTTACIPGIDPNCEYDPNVTNDHRTRVNVTVDNQSITDGTDIAKVWVYDQHGNPVPAAKVTTSTAEAQLVVPTGQPKSTVADGTVELAYTTTVPDNPFTAQAKVFITNSLGEPVELVFQPQPGTSPTDPVWNVAANSSPVTLHFTDTVEPGAPVITSPQDGELSNHNPLPVTGTGEPGATVQVYIDGHPAVDANGDPITTTVDANGDWSVAVPITDGTHTLTAGQTDPSGNVSPNSTGVTVTIDTTPPAKPTIDKANKVEISGTVPTSPAIDDGTTVTVRDKNDHVICTTDVNPVTGAWSCPTPAGAVEGPITAVATDKAGNPSEPATGVLDTTPPGKPVIDQANKQAISGTVPLVPTIDDGTTLTVTDKNGDPIPGCVNLPVDSQTGAWSCVPPANAVNGEIKAVATDPAGNPSEPGLGNLDTIPPDAPVVDPTNGSQITGKAEPGSTMTITDGSGQPIPGCTGVKADPVTGVFSCTPTDKLDPGSTVKVSATDDAGNTSPTTTVVVSALAVSVDKPNPNPAEVVTVTGEHFNPGEKVTITMCSNCVVLGEGVADANGKVVVSVTIPADATPGEHTIVATGEQSGAVSTTITVVEVPKAPTGGTVVATTSPIGLLVGLSIMALGALAMARRKLVVKR